jgi:hypothetical protein
MQTREEIKSLIEVGNYQNLADRILDGMGLILKKLARRKKMPSIWISSLALYLCSLLVGFALVYLFDENQAYRATLNTFVFIIITTGFLALLLGKIYVDRTFEIFRKQVLDVIQSVDDLLNLRKWIEHAINTKFQFLAGLLYAILIPSILVVVLLSSPIGFMGLGMTLAILFPMFQGGVLAYYLVVCLFLPGRLSRYEYQLYLNDPSQSDVMGHLSNLLTNGLFFFSLVMVLATVSLSYMWRFYSIGISIFSLLIMWLPIIAIFILNQNALTKIVTNSKKRKLKEIQNRIEQLETEDDIANIETIEAINRLMDYHDRIRDTKNSGFNFRSVINLFNSLLLPLISAIGSRIFEIIELFR